MALLKLIKSQEKKERAVSLLKGELLRVMP
jgi:hypothetical protein